MKACEQPNFKKWGAKYEKGRIRRGGAKYESLRTVKSLEK
jgi:hypothetical protein